MKQYWVDNVLITVRDNGRTRISLESGESGCDLGHGDTLDEAIMDAWEFANNLSHTIDNLFFSEKNETEEST